MLDSARQLLVAKNAKTSINLLPALINRHGLITGATGTGKTISLQVIAESLSAIGVPVVITDIKGDVSGVSQPGGGNAKVEERIGTLGLKDKGFSYQGCPVCLWDIFGKDGHPLRTTISEMGPLLLSRVMDLTETQIGVLQMLFKVADDEGLLLLDLKDLQKLVEFVAQNRAQFSASHGNIAPASIGSIQRALLGLEQQGGATFFGEPALDINDLMRVVDGKGVVNILAADRLMQSPRIYASFLLSLMSELYENLPEVGDLPQPKLVLFFDEAHLMFADAPKILLERIEQVVKLIRSKGVGIFFVTQNPMDIPQGVLAQLGNRLQHALRAYTPAEQKAVKAAAGAFRPNPEFKTEDAINNLGVGEALVSFLDPKGIPLVVERAFVVPPESRIGPLNPAERQAAITGSKLYGKYDNPVDRESAYEVLTARVQQRLADDAAAKAAKNAKPEKSFAGEIISDFAKKTQQSITRNIANQVGRSLIRGVLGGLFGGKR